MLEFMFLLVTMIVAPILVGMIYRQRTYERALCRTCRYVVEGLPASVCPECGGDLSGSGTIAAGEYVGVGLRIPRPFVHGVLAICLAACVLLCLVVWFPYRLSTAEIVAGSVSGLFTRCTVSASGSKTYSGFMVDPHGNRAAEVVAESKARYRLIRPRCTAVLSGPRGNVSFAILNDRMQARYEGPGGSVTTQDAFDDADILRWMDAAGVDIRDARAAIEATSIAAMIRHAVVGSGEEPPAGSASVLAGLVIVRISISDRFPWVAPWMICIAVGLGAIAWWEMARAERNVTPRS